MFDRTVYNIESFYYMKQLRRKTMMLLAILKLH